MLITIKFMRVMKSKFPKNTPQKILNGGGGGGGPPALDPLLNALSNIPYAFVYIINIAYVDYVYSIFVLCSHPLKKSNGRGKGEHIWLSIPIWSRRLGF